MSISLILIGIISLIVIAGTVFLLLHKNEELTDQKKSNILTIVATVVFLSLAVTTFKNRNSTFKSTSINNGKVDV